MWNMSNKSRRQTKDGRSSEIWIRYMAAIASQHLHKLFMFHKSIKWQTNVFRAFYCDLLMLLFHFNEWNGSNQSTTMTVCTVHCALCRCVCSMYEFLFFDYRCVESVFPPSSSPTSCMWYNKVHTKSASTISPTHPLTNHQQFIWTIHFKPSSIGCNKQRNITNRIFICQCPWKRERIDQRSLIAVQLKVMGQWKHISIFYCQYFLFIQSFYNNEFHITEESAFSFVILSNETSIHRFHSRRLFGSRP